MILEAIKLAIRAIGRNLLRSLMTILGVVIGVAAVIAMVTLGQGTAALVTTEVQSLGTNLLIIRPGQIQIGRGAAAGQYTSFEIGDVDAIENEISGVRAAAASNTRLLTVVFGNQNYLTTVVGTDNRFFDVRSMNIELGREFSDSEVRTGASVCILGSTVSEFFFGASDPTGSAIRIRQIPCTVIGVLESSGATAFGSDQDDIVLAPWQMFTRRISGSDEVSLIYASMREGVDSDEVIDDISELLRQRRGLTPNEDDDFSVLDMEQMAETLASITGVLTGLLAAIAAISLLVGGIGIMNIMLVSVTERTREIGIRLAVGASEGQVLAQFLMEAVVLSLCGGIIGVALGLSLAAVAAPYLSIPFVLDPSIVLIAFGFSALVGVVFGYLPARRAARLNPIDALRHE